MKFVKKLLGPPFANQHIAEITGQKTHIRPLVWTKTPSTGRCIGYSHITGGLVLPTFSSPGFMLAVGVSTDGTIIHAMDEFEADDPHAIIRRAQEIQADYGPGVIQNWWGNPKSLMSIVNEVNIEGNPVLISQPVDFDQPDAFGIYTARLKVGLSASLKTFYINDCACLKGHIMSFVQGKAAKAEDNPAIMITGALLHTLLMVRPWEQAVETTELIPTSHEEHAAYASEQALKSLEAEVYA